MDDGNLKGRFPMVEGGGGPSPNFLSTIHKLNLLGQFGDGEGGGDPSPNFLAHWRSKKWYKLSKLGEGGGFEVIWTKSKRTATFFGKPSLTGDSYFPHRDDSKYRLS